MKSKTLSLIENILKDAKDDAGSEFIVVRVCDELYDEAMKINKNNKIIIKRMGNNL